jgi:hypothetical protein
MTAERDPLEAGMRFVDLPAVLNVNQLAAALQVGPNQVRDLVAAGKLRRLEFHRYLRVSHAEFMRFLADQTAVDEEAAS